MNTIKITTTQTTEEEREIEIPSYFKNICFYWKIVSETTAVRVYEGYAPHERGIELSNPKSILEGRTNMAEPCTAKEFEIAFLDAVTKLSSIAEHGIVLETENN